MKNKQEISVLERKIKELGLGDDSLLREIRQWTIDKDKMPLFDLENIELTEEGIKHFVEQYQEMSREVQAKAEKLADTKTRYSALKPFHKLFRRVVKNAAKGKGKLTTTIFLLGEDRRWAVVDMCRTVHLDAEVDGMLVHVSLRADRPYPFVGYVAWALCTGFVGAVATAISLLAF